MEFAEICQSRNIPPIPAVGILDLAKLVIDDERYAVPVFAAFRELALPIASEWLTRPEFTARKHTVFCRLCLLVPLLPQLQLLLEQFIAMHSEGSYLDLWRNGPNPSELLRACLQLLLHNHGRFARYFSAESVRALTASKDLRSRQLGLAVLALIMNVSEDRLDAWVAEFTNEPNSEQLQFSEVLEDARMRQQDLALLSARGVRQLPADQCTFESHLVTNVGGIYVPRISELAGGNSAIGAAAATAAAAAAAAAAVDSSFFLETESTKRNLFHAATCLLRDAPLLVRGESGSGKTALVEHLHSRIRGGSELLRIHLGDQTDAKSLVGTYTTGAKPGTFEWTPGALTTAVQRGMWVLVEDIDRAPNEIVAVLIPLLESRELVVPSRNQVIRAAPGFQLVATTSSSSAEIIGARSWAPIELSALTNTDLQQIIMARRPFIRELEANMLIAVYQRVEEWQHHHASGTRASSVRDLMKLVMRISEKYDVNDRFREAVACFTAFLPKPWPLIEVIADAMHIPPSTVQPLLTRYIPQVTLTDSEVHIGRAQFERRPVTSSAARNLDVELSKSRFTLTQPTLKLLEDVSVAVQHLEPVLLVGETGTGKTAIVQHLAKLARRKLVVINVSQQVEAGDLIGGFKPVDARQLAGPLLEDFYELFDGTFNRAKNHKFLELLDVVVSKQQWGNVVKVLRQAVKLASEARGKNSDSEETHCSKRAKTSTSSFSSAASSALEWSRFAERISAFDERVKSAQKTAQFQFMEGLLIRAIRSGHWVLLDEFNLAPADTIEGIGELISSRMLTMIETGGDVVHAHDSFRLFANMNPATDVGKRDLPRAVRSQFTELWAPSPDSDPEALREIVKRYLPHGTELSVVNDVAQFYIAARDLGNSHQLADGAGQRPHFSIRTLSRALVTASAIAPTYHLRRALFEAFSMCFLTLLDGQSADKINELLHQWILSKIPNMKSVMSQIPHRPNSSRPCLRLNHWWMPCGEGFVPSDDTGLLLDPNDTSYILTPSVTSNLMNLVRASALKMFPVLIQGPTSSGKTSMISFLARRTGHKMVRINNHEHTDLSEYLGGYESDQNGQLVFKEGALVTALREGHWLVLDELNLAPTDVLEALNRLLDDNRELLVPETQELIKPHPDFILYATQNPPGIYAGRKVLSRAFRNRFLELHFGDIPENELEAIVEKRCGIAPSYAAKIVMVYRELGRRKIQRVFEQVATLRDLFRWAQRPATGYEELAFNGFTLLGERARTSAEKFAVREVIETVMKVKLDVDITTLPFIQEIMSAAPPEIVWTKAMRRVLALVCMAIEHNEPILLVGETGCGKTTIVQTIAAAFKQRLITLNAHQNTETGDLVGSQRPVRGNQDSNKLFEWVDGPLVTALKDGDIFLLDEISLADDSVLERLNSVLEQERTLFVPEIGSVHAQKGFQFLATMNPGGDYGKKELSPALRNRFTEIWVPTVEDDADLSLIVSSRLPKSDFNSTATHVIVSFSKWFAAEFNAVVSLRDILSWVEFVNAAGLNSNNLVHGACMVFIDGLGILSQFMGSSELTNRARGKCLKKLKQLVDEDSVANVDAAVIIRDVASGLVTVNGIPLPKVNESTCDTESPGDALFSFSAPTSALNAMRVLRAMQVRKPVLLEGSPGAGKTSLIVELAKLCGVPLTRINLSDQTDLSDLFGQDVPLNEPGKFGWRSAPFLRAMEKGEWVLLDEMNLAPQPVLEGLNACLDHRGEAYIPELDRVFPKHANFTVFAAQNPQGQGGGRKGLPKSFINRFSVVYVDQLGLKDLYAITETTHATVDISIRNRLCDFIEDLAQWCSSRILSGGPFEFNLRDTLRWLDLIEETHRPAQDFLRIIVTDRLRSSNDKSLATEMFHKHFPKIEKEIFNPVDLQPHSIKIGETEVSRSNHTFVHSDLSLLPSQIELLETALTCVRQAWPLILVGLSGSGKTSLVRLIAQVCGAKLLQFSMTADIDSTDLLGEFDQLEQQSELQRLWSFIEEATKHMMTDVKDSVLSDAIKNRDLDAAKYMLREVEPIQSAIQAYEASDFSKPIFHWVDGMLVKAVEQGDWLILDNANLCSAAVLDRLNSLLERGGSLAINECANEDGSPRLIKPHPNFRLFLTVNPKYGELSRAMRNRGVELWVTENSYKSSKYSSDSSRSLSIAGALPLVYTRPLSNARLMDTNKRSWLRALVIDHRTPLEFLDREDPELAAFAKTCTSMPTKIQKFSTLYEAWMAFQLRACLSNVLNSDLKGTIFQISAQKRKKDSIDCDFDVFGMVESIIPHVIGGGDLGSVAIELVYVRDPSRIHVFREWLLEYCARTPGTEELASTVKLFLGQRYDFSSGGEGMEALWQRYGRKFGFATEQQHLDYLQTIQASNDFDSMTISLGVEFAQHISEIRSVLASTMSYGSSVDSAITDAIAKFESTVGDTPRTRTPLLSDCFREIWFSLALAYSVDRNAKLGEVLSKLTVFAQLSTAQLESVLRASDTSNLYVPDISISRPIEASLIVALHSTQQGQAQIEIDQLVETLRSNSWAIAKTTEPEFMVKELLKNALENVRSVIPSTNIAIRDELTVASNCVNFAQSLLFLYVCPLPLDPAIAQHVWYERYLNLKQQFENDEESWRELQQVFSSKSSQMNSWLLNRHLDQEEVPSIWRPAQSSIGVVHRHMVSSASLANNCDNVNAKTTEEIALVLKNTEHLSDQLQRASGYRDLTSAVKSALSLLKIGLTLKQRDALIDQNTTSFKFLDPISVSCTSFAVDTDEHLLALESLRCLRKVPETISVLFDSVYRQWTLERLRVEEQQREKLAGFRYTGDDDDAERVEQEFRQMFPDYDESSELPNENDESSDQFASKFMQNYCDLFLGSHSDEIAKVLVTATQSLKHTEGQSSDSHLAALYLALHERSTDGKSNASKNDSQKLFNFYSDSTPTESSIGVRFAERVLNRVAPLLEKWPEHDTLQTLKQISDAVIDLPPGSPVALHLSKAEQLMHYLSDWDKYASKEFKLNDLVAGCADIIVRWRRLELKTWPSLFDIEKHRASDQAAKFWFHLYETLVMAVAEDLADTARVLVIFLSESTVGQYETRLRILEAFERHLLLINSHDVYRCVANVRSYFAQFSHLVSLQQEAPEKQLRKNVNEVVQLASLRDTNPAALKQSAQRSHRQLFKYVKKFRDVLQAKAVTSNEQAALIPVSGCQFVSTHYPYSAEVISKKIATIQNSAEWQMRPQHLKDLDRTSLLMENYIKKVCESVETSSLESFATDVVKRAQKLRSETPGTWSKENKKLISGLKVEKQQLLTATLRELRSAGISSAITKKTLEQLELIRVLATTPSLSNTGISYGDSQFFALIELIPKLRSAVSDVASSKDGSNTVDVPITDLQRGLGLVENSFHYLLKLRETAWKHFKGSGTSKVLKNLHSLVSDISNSSEPAVFELERTRNIVADATHGVKQVMCVVDAVLENQNSNISTAPVYALVAQAEVYSDIQLQSSIPLEWFQKLKSALSTLSVSLSNTSFGGLLNANLSSLIDLVNNSFDTLPRIKDHVSFEEAHISVVRASSAVLITIQKVIKKIDEYNGSTQSEDNEPEGHEEDEDDTDWFSKLIKVSRQLLMLLQSTDIVVKFETSVRHVIALSRNSPASASSLAASLLTFLSGYAKLNDTVECTFGDIMRNSSSGILKLSNMLLVLSKEGFCSPQPLEDDSDDEDDQKGDGVGLGDGSGKNSSSKDVDEEDDDVTEAMQTSNPDQQEKEEEEGEDNAKEMEGDMAGEVEDLPPQDEDEENKSEDDQDDEDDLDEEMGDLDDMDSNAVDEKMWNDERQENLDKEKQSDQNVDGQKDEDVEAAEDENNQGPSAELGEGDENDNEEEDNGSDADDSDADAQDDKAQQGDERQQADDGIEDKDALELPSDMEMDGDDDEDSGSDDHDDEQADSGPEDVDDSMDTGMDEQPGGDADDAQQDNVEDSEQPDVPEEMIADDADKKEDDEAANKSDDEEENMEVEDDANKEQMNESAPNEAPDGDGDADGADVEGLEGLNDEKSNEKQDEATTTENATDSRAEGATEDASNEQSNLASGGTAGANQAEEEEKETGEDNVNDDTSNNRQIEESLRQLGDAMKEFHDRQKAIREHQDREEESNDNTKSSDDSKPLKGHEDLEHVGADDAFDTQALGKAVDNEKQNIDEKMAIEDDLDASADEQEVAGDDETGAERGGAGAGEVGASSEDDNDEDDDPRSLASANVDRMDDEDESDDTNNERAQPDEAEKLGSDGAVDLWQVFESKTQDLALLLGEQLRLILEPTVASKLRGDYRTGKRLNMKRIIPYIASEFRKDKIWLRRSKPAKREYQVMLALDDSKSMGEPAVVDLAFQAITLVGKALGAIEAGQIGIAKFGSTTEIVHPLDKPLTPQAGNEVFKKFGFNQQRTNVHNLLETTLDMFSTDHNASSEQWKLEIIVSDGIADDHEGLRKLVRRAYDEKVMLVFVILDALNKDTSILNMNEVKYPVGPNGETRLQVVKYMESFAFDYYVIVRDIGDLPMVLASVLRQYFQSVDS